VIPAPYLPNALVLQVIDGDNLLCKVDRGMRDYSEWSVRLAGTNAREEHMPGGPEAIANLTALFPAGTRVVLATLKPDKFAPRVDAAVAFLYGPAGHQVETDLATLLIAEQWAAPWNGRGPKPLPPWPRTVAAPR
jgi:endonuclease YncB( thermonuclease family)